MDKKEKHKGREYKRYSDNEKEGDGEFPEVYTSIYHSS